MLADGETEALGLREAEVDELGDIEGEILLDVEELGLREDDGLKELLGERDADADGDRLLEGEIDVLLDGEIEADTEALGEREALAEALGEREADGLLLVLAEGDNEALGDTPCKGEVPYQSTPGRGPGLPSS